MHHKDPFDRMLLAQAREEGVTVVSHDRLLQPYDVPILGRGRSPTMPLSRATVRLVIDGEVINIGDVSLV